MIPYISLSAEKIDTSLEKLSGQQRASFASVNIEKLAEQCVLFGEKALSNRFLTDKEKRKFASFLYNKRKMEWLAGRIAAKHAVIKMFNKKLHREELVEEKEWKNWQLEADENGRPFFVSRGEKPDVSISHSGSVAVAMVTKRRLCGIDIQKISPKIAKIEKKFIDQKEKEFKNSPGIDLLSCEEFLTLIWSAKEALRKGSGHKRVIGFMEMKLFSVTEETSGFFVFHFTCTRDQEKNENEKIFKTSQTVKDEFAISCTV